MDDKSFAPANANKLLVLKKSKKQKKTKRQIHLLCYYFILPLWVDFVSKCKLASWVVCEFVLERMHAKLLLISFPLIDRKLYALERYLRIPIPITITITIPIYSLVDVDPTSCARIWSQDPRPAPSLHPLVEFPNLAQLGGHPTRCPAQDVYVTRA